MSVEERVEQWEKYCEIISKLYSEIEDIFKPHYWYDGHWQYHEDYYFPDEQTPHLLKLSELLANVLNFVKSYLNELQAQYAQECNERHNAEIAFEAWCRNLCPKLMCNIPRYLRSPSFDEFEVFNEVAECLKVGYISYEATQEAINEWQTTMLKKSA